MTTHVMRNDADREYFISITRKRPLPMTANLTKGVRRTNPQNKLQRWWINAAADQLEYDREELRGMCKLMFGVPILREENEEFRRKYDTIVKPLPYETKVSLMCEPLDMPVTRMMTTEQKTRYLESLMKYLSEQGVIPPELMRKGEM